MVSPKLSVSPAEVDFVEEASFPVLEDLVGQGGQGHQNMGVWRFHSLVVLKEREPSVGLPELFRVRG